jgi:hypothetical protein
MVRLFSRPMDHRCPSSWGSSDSMDPSHLPNRAEFFPRSGSSKFRTFRDTKKCRSLHYWRVVDTIAFFACHVLEGDGTKKSSRWNGKQRIIEWSSFFMRCTVINEIYSSATHRMAPNFAKNMSPWYRVDGGFAKP